MCCQQPQPSPSGDIAAVYDRARELAQLPGMLLLSGERGTEVAEVAKLVHENSPRAQGPFVALDCREIPADQQPEHLAHYLKEANGGTLFLQNIYILNQIAWIKLRQFLHTGAFKASLNASGLIANVRLIASSDSRRSQTFDPELFAAEIVVPPLRERSDDEIKLMATVLLAGFYKEYRSLGASIVQASIEPAALPTLLNHPWNGNVDEMKGVTQRIIHENMSELKRGALPTMEGRSEMITITEPMLRRALTTPPPAATADARRAPGEVARIREFQLAVEAIKGWSAYSNFRPAIRKLSAAVIDGDPAAEKALVDLLRSLWPLVKMGPRRLEMDVQRQVIDLIHLLAGCEEMLELAENGVDSKNWAEVLEKRSDICTNWGLEGVQVFQQAIRRLKRLDYEI